ncbi:MAG: PAS domain-containing protein [Proteobacteria bacterium]|uniref:PAS domain-containing sensor histidine kinase n=1 Tax=Aquabacterium sp. TaxID=1872578 RepID=UPI0035C6E5FD|nr:PAS domain-containing protein [Pseudomonadota bacterium]
MPTPLPPADGSSTLPGNGAMPTQSADTASWFGAPLLDERPAAGMRSGEPPPRNGAASAHEPAPYFFRVYRAFLTARATLSLMLLLLLGSLWSMGTHPPAWMLTMALCYATLAWAVWWLPSQRVPASPQQLTLRPRQALASVGVDLVFFAALHQFTGSSFNTQALLVLPVLMAAVLMPRILALGAAAVATLSLLGSAWVQALGSGALTTLMTQAGLTGFGLFAIAILANELATRLAREERSARGSMELARQQAELNRLVIEEMSEGVMVVDRQGRVRTANPAARRLLSARGQTPAAPFQLRGVPAWGPLVHAVERALGRPLQAEGGQEVRLRFDDHVERDLRLRVRFTRGQAAEASEDMCVMLLEDLRTVRARQRQDKLAAMGRMSAGIAHEIRNPLAAIAQANALMAEDAAHAGANPAQVRLTQLVSDNVQRLKHIVDDILAVAPGLRPPAPLIDPVEAVMATCNEWRATQGLAAGADSLLDVDLGSVTRQASPPKVRFEPEHLQRVLVNLLDNALRYQSGQPGALHVGLRWLPGATQHGLLMLSVANDGEPMSADTERSLFEPFFSTSSRGTGLGLYISRELCERHGASIDYRQHPPSVRHRNEFFVTMPVEPSGTAALAP